MSILCYHAVDPAWESRLSVPPTLFERQCEWLARHRQVVPLDVAAQSVSGQGALPGRRAAITFDDGFNSVYEFAWPVLRRSGLTAAVFLVARTLTPEGQAVDWADGPPGRALSTMTKDQILEMQDGGVAFGSHSLAHRDLSELTDEECERDLKTSREILEAVLGREVRTLAYPRGLHNERVHRAASRAGFSHAFGTSKPTPRPGPLAIPRIGVYPNNGGASLRVKTSSAYPRLRTSRLWPGASKANTH